MDLLGVQIDVTRPMRGLSIADQQMVEIARALASDSRLIIMDEPTAPLTPKEVETLFAIARRLRDEGRTIIFISHRLEEVRVLCDRVTIFRDGNKIATDTIANLSDADIIRLMIGRPLKEYLHKTRATIGEVALKVENLTLPGVFERHLRSKCARARSSASAALSAPGAPTLRAPCSASPAASGTVLVNGKPVEHQRPVAAPSRSGLAFVPEDRAVAGIFRTLSVEAEHHRRRAAPDRARAASSAAPSRTALGTDSVKKLRIRLASLRQPIGELSGGNQQKAILARWLLTDPSVLILDEPTRGIDIGVKAEFYDMIGELAASGRAILLISSELPELLAPLRPRPRGCRRAASPPNLSRADATQESIMHAAVPQARRSGRMNLLRSIFLRREAGIAVMIVLFCLAVGAVKPQFLTLDQLRIILLLTPLIMIAAMGQMMVIVARHVDLSIGSTLGFSAMVSGMLYRWDETWLGFNVPWWTGIPLSVAAGAAARSRQRHPDPGVPAARDHRHARHAQPLSRPDLHPLQRQADRSPVDSVRVEGRCRRPRRSSAFRGSSSSPSAWRSSPTGSSTTRAMGRQIYAHRLQPRRGAAARYHA